MKISKNLLCILSLCVLFLTACWSKPNMSFENALDSVTHSSLKEIMNDAENYKQSFNITTELHIPENNVDANISFSTDNKENTKDLQWESLFTINIDASGDWDNWRETIKIGWEAIFKHLSNAIYFKLNSLNLSDPDNLIENIDFNLTWIKNQWFSFEITEEILNTLQNELPEDFDLKQMYNKEKLQELEKKLEKDLKDFKNNLKKTIVNEGSSVYKWIYSEFNWYNARKFSIDKEKLFYTTTEYIKTLIPEEYIDDYTKAIEDVNIDEIIENFPLKNFEWYLVITWKDKVQVVIENIDIKNSYSTTKINWTFGNDRYELVVKENDENIFIISAKLKNYHYNIIMKVWDLEIITWTITPKKSNWKINIDFDLSINFENNNNKINIPLKGWWSWEKISKFNIEIPKNSKNLLEDILENSDYTELAPLFIMNSKQISSLENPFIAGWILLASLMPRMQSAQDRARDVSRKTSLSQIQTAIIISQWDKWVWPGMDAATKWIPVSKIEDELINVWLSSIPSDPNYYSTNYWLWENYKDNSAIWEYLYLVTKRNWTENAGFVLMAKTETEWWSNRVVCENSNWLKKWYIKNNTDIAKISTCNYISKWDLCWNNSWNCTYTDDNELRYIVLY